MIPRLESGYTDDSRGNHLTSNVKKILGKKDAHSLPPPGQAWDGLCTLGWIDPIRSRGRESYPVRKFYLTDTSFKFAKVRA